jgi:tripartite ATP-independent transporter DctM subunit
MLVLSVFLGALLFFSLAGLPIGFAIGLTTMVLMFVLGMPDAMVLARRMISGVDVYTLLAIPFFMLAGEFMNKAGLVRDILLFANAIMGRIRGGLAYVNVVASMLFAGISGSAVADAAALGSLEMPMMERSGYDREFSAAITAASSVIGPIIPPSIPMIILGSIGQISISKLFLGGAVPGLLIGVALMGVCWVMARKRSYPSGERVSFREFLRILSKTVWALILPLIILGGVLGGIFTATEAGAVAVVYACIISYTVYGVKFDAYPAIFRAAALNTGVVMLVCATAMALTWYLAVGQVPQLLTNFITGVTSDRIVFLLIMNIVLFLVGMFIDLTPSLFLLVPILLPVSRAYGIDPVHFGVIMVANLCVGLITPPVGTVLYVTNSIAKISLGQLVRELLPMYLVLFVVVLLITYVPFLVLWLPSFV